MSPIESHAIIPVTENAVLTVLSNQQKMALAAGGDCYAVGVRVDDRVGHLHTAYDPPQATVRFGDDGRVWLVRDMVGGLVARLLDSNVLVRGRAEALRWLRRTPTGASGPSNACRVAGWMAVVDERQ